MAHSASRIGASWISGGWIGASRSSASWIGGGWIGASWTGGGWTGGSCADGQEERGPAPCGAGAVGGRARRLSC